MDNFDHSDYVSCLEYNEYAATPIEIESSEFNSSIVTVQYGQSYVISTLWNAQQETVIYTPLNLKITSEQREQCRYGDEIVTYCLYDKFVQPKLQTLDLESELKNRLDYLFTNDEL